MRNLQRPAGPLLLQAVLTAATFILFGQLALRHVGESAFLSDQTDQLQLFERFLRLTPDGLLGGVMSGTAPPTRSVGPLGALLFGIPVGLGFGVDAVQVLTSVLLVATACGAFLALARIDLTLAWAWLLLFVANPIVWWNASMLWANTLMLVAGNLMLALMAMCLRRPTFARWCGMILVAIFAAQVSLVAITALPPIAFVALRTLPVARCHRPGRVLAIAIGVVTVLAIGPFLLAETMTGFANTRAALTHVAEDQPDAPPNGRAIVPILQRAADPTGGIQAAGAPGWMAVAIGTAVAFVSLLAWAWSAWLTPRDGGRRPDDAIFWVVATAIVGIAGQVAFFVIENRGLLSYHYIAMLVPLYAVPPAALVAWIAARTSPRIRDLTAAALGITCLAVVVWRAPDWADDYAERTPWTFEHISGGVDALCGHGQSASTLEGPGFQSIIPGHDGVLKYLMTRRFVSCAYDEESDLLLIAERDRPYEASRHERNRVFGLVQVVEPGIALYRREGLSTAGAPRGLNQSLGGPVSR